MKKTSLVLLLATLFFGVLSYYFAYHADGGADGLGTFIPFVFVGVLCIAFLLAFLVSLLFNKGQSLKTKGRITGIAVALPVLGFISVVGTFAYFSMDYSAEHNAQVELNKTVLENVSFEDEDFGVKFQHVSGRVTEYHGETPIPTLITPKIEGGKLIVPIDNESYLSPNVLLKIDVEATHEFPLFFENLKKELDLESNKFKKTSTSSFVKLEQDVEVWKVNLTAISSEDMSKLLNYFSLGKQDYPELIYLFKSPKTPNRIWVLLVPNTILSVPASVERMTTSNFDDGNLWFHTLEFIEH